MTSLQSKVEAVKAAATSTATCTSATSVLLKELLATETETASATTKTTSRNAKSTTSARGKTAGAARTAANKKEELSPKEKAALAAHIVNVALKSLTEASKPAPAAAPSTPCRRQNSGEDLRKTPSRRHLRRSNSLPMTPMQPRSLNRTSTSPMTAVKPAPKPTTTSTPPTTCLATVECLRASFACLRALHSSGAVPLPDLQLENGMSSFIAKLVGLGLQEHALKELNILKRRLDALGTSPKTKPKTTKAAAADTKIKGLAELLDFGDAKFSGATLGVVISTQMHIFRLISLGKKAAIIEAAKPFLTSACPTSPMNLLLESAKESAQAKTKAARQLDLLSQLLTSLAPSVSNKDDDAAKDSRLSCSPATALEFQAIALEARLHWWPMAGHKADVNKDIMSPLSRCITSFLRRSQSDLAGSYRRSLDVFQRIMKMVDSQHLEPTLSSKSPLAIIYQALGTAAQAARLYKDSADWILKIKQTLDPESDSAAKCCAYSAQLVAVYGKQVPLPDQQLTKALTEVIDALQGMLKGDSTELEELMTNLSAARRSSVGILSSNKQEVSEEIVDLLNKLILQFPRFSVRWLGKAPTRDSAAKDRVRHEQRRQILLSSVPQILDSAFMVAKSHIDKNKMTWELLDGLLQECLMLLDSMGDISTTGSKTNDGNSAYTKISHLYFMFFHWYRRNNESKPGDKTPLRALRRSVDCVKDRPSDEKEKAQTTAKLEYFADLCKHAGRINDARDALKLICTNMVEDGILSAVAASLSEKSPAVAWGANDKTEALSRTLGAMVKLDQSWNDWTFFLADVERAAVLERIIQLLLSDTSNEMKSDDIKEPVTEALLRIYSVDRFPIRRLRTLTQLLTMAIGDQNQFQDLREQTEAALQACRSQDLADDSGLATYVADLEASLASTVALVESHSEWRTSHFECPINAWRVIVTECSSKDDVLSRVNDAEGLLRQLGAIANFARLRGEDEFLLSILTLSANLSQKLSDSSTDLLVQSHSDLADQYTHLGYSDKAEEILKKAQEFVQSSSSDPDLAAVNLFVSFTEHQLAKQNSAAAQKMLLQGQAAFEKSSSSRRGSRQQRKLLLARAACLFSRIKWDQGEYQHALFHAKTSVRLLYSDWTKLEARWQSAPKASSAQASREGSPDTDDSIIKGDASARIDLSDGPDSWALACGLLTAMLHLSSVYAHLGMFQETVYYAEKAHQVANSTNASIYRAQAASWIGSVWLKASKLDKSLGYLNEARQLMTTAVKPTRQAFQLACELSASFGEMKDHENELLLLELAEVTLGTLNTSNQGAITGVSAEQVVHKMANLTLKNAAATTATTATRRTRTTKSAAPATKTAAKTTTKTTAAARTMKRATAPKAKTAAPSKAVVVADNGQTSDLKASMLMYKALVHLSKGDWAGASALLEEAKQMSTSLRESLRVQISEATCLIEQGIKQMEGDSVFSVVKESTISYPSIHAASDKNTTEKTSPNGPSPRKPQSRAISAERKASKENAAFVETLEQAQAQLMEAQAAAAISGNGHLVHRISALLQSTGIFLSAASQRVPKNIGNFGYAACSVEFARNLTWKRERSTVATEQLNPSFSETGWPLALQVEDDRRASIITADDMTKFQRDYVDIIPEAWSVFSVSLSDNRKDLCITKLQAGQSPFVLRLPLERVASRDGEEELFDFQRGHEELMDIIKATNDSCHNAGDYTGKGAKAAWWAQREDLDNRFKDLLDNVEQVWLGGFKGIFSQHRHRPELLAKFQKAFAKIMDKHLPSRRQVRGKKTTKAPKVTLEPRILDLFIGLGDPSTTSPDNDMDEPLNDLLYFVVDILQFQGERNAYDEIDFDSMVLDTLDALQAYHTAAKTSESEEGAHSILILDKSLHAFPWESLPCMEGLAYSRVPSLSCLRRLITEQRAAEGTHGVDHHTVSPTGGTYILNPGSDLKNTLATFEKPLKTLGDSWKGIVSRCPTEDEFEGALKGSDIVLYFGHGSGAQYIRGKTIRRLEKCKAAALLMGCSSASLQNVGEYECHGPVWNYMLAGCPAVVGTLWDVTDKDIDRYAGRLFEEWGLMKKGTFVDDGKPSAKGKGKGLFADKKGKGSSSKRGEEESPEREDGRETSLVEAVAKARDACRFRYITAGAVCVYGIPVYISRDKANGA
ncbi:Separin [Colletotrichum sp. SAR11_240]|nr:Separin [Colletotrichum sp. SAR11_240]